MGKLWFCPRYLGALRHLHPRQTYSIATVGIQLHCAPPLSRGMWAGSILLDEGIQEGGTQLGPRVVRHERRHDEVVSPSCFSYFFQTVTDCLGTPFALNTPTPTTTLLPAKLMCRHPLARAATAGYSSPGIPVGHRVLTPPPQPLWHPSYMQASQDTRSHGGSTGLPRQHGL